MKKSTKAALLSGLVFPGLGHLYLKRWVVGVTLAGIAAFALYYLLSITMGIALEVSQRVAEGAVPADIASITGVVSQELSGMQQATDLASMSLLACWLTGVVGAYLHGRRQDRIDTAHDPGV